MNQCWNIVYWTLGNKLQWNRNRNLSIFIQENAFENVVWKMAAILSRPQCVNSCHMTWYLCLIIYSGQPQKCYKFQNLVMYLLSSLFRIRDVVVWCIQNHKSWRQDISDLMRRKDYVYRQTISLTNQWNNFENYTINLYPSPTRPMS